MKRVEILANYAYHSEWCGVADATNPTERCKDESCQQYRDEQAQRLDEALRALEETPEVENTLTADYDAIVGLMIHQSGGRVEIPRSVLVDPPHLEISTWANHETQTIIFTSQPLGDEDETSSTTQTQSEGGEHG